jgi:HSP20 family protein
MGKKIRPFSKRIKIEAKIDSIAGEIFIQKREIIGWNDNWIPFVDISEGKSIIVIRAEVPGVKAEDISIKLHSNKVELKGIKKEPDFPLKYKYIRLERETGRFRRVIFLPKAVSIHGAEALLENGILTLVLNKTGEIKTEKIDIKIDEPKE